MSELSSYVRQLLKEDPLYRHTGNADSIQKRVAFNVRRIRKIKGFTQLQLANAMGVKQPFIARIESGKNNISLKKLEQISQVLSIDPILLLRPIYEEGTPQETGRMVVDVHFQIQALNTGMEIFFKRCAEVLIGTRLEDNSPFRELAARVLMTGEEVRDQPLHFRENGFLEKKRISARPIRNENQDIIGVEILSKTDL